MSLFELILKSKGFPLQEARKQLTSLQKMSVEEFLGWQEKQKWDIVKFHYNNNSFYRQKIGQHLPDKWEDLPVITKKDLQKPLPELLSKGYTLKNTHVGNTSGSSGVPFYYAKDKFSHAMTWAVITDRYSMYGLDFDSKQARFYGIPKEFTGYWKEQLKDRVMNRRRFPVFDLSDNVLERFFNRLRTGGFDYLYGYTSSLVLFARFLVKRNVILKDACPTIKVCITTSELSTEEDHQILKQAFGVPHIREYGASETCLMGFDAPDGKWRFTEESLYNEVVNSNNVPADYGLEGNVLCTSLFNKAFPIIRYQVGDMAVLKDREPDSIYRSIDKLVGRTNDVAILPSGKVSPGLTFYYVSRSILESSGVLKEFIIRQTALDHFVFDVVADRDLTDTEINQIKEKITLYLEPGINYSINRVDKIDRPASGKLKHFYSELKKN
ncbi:MAG: hypothetical protein ACTHJ0_13455 [Flavipsychrobacter sp.]